MSDDTMGVMRPAIPSRATGELKPLPPLQTDFVPPKRQRKAERLPAPEIRRITTHRKKNMRKAKVKTRNQRIAASKAQREKIEKRTAKSPNRPLQLKHQMHALLDSLKTLQGAEHQAFTDAVLAMQDLSKPGRTRVLEALAKVYAA